MRGEVVALALVVGLGTWAFRYLPVRWRGSPQGRGRPGPNGGGSRVGEGRAAEGRSSHAGDDAALSEPLGSNRRSGLAGRFLAGRFLAGIGVAAVAALAASSLRPYLVEVLSAAGLPWRAGMGPEPAPTGGVPAVAPSPASDWLGALPLGIGLGATVLAFLPRRSVAAATLLGAAAYGLTSWLLGAVA